MPKYDEAQEKYLTTPGASINMFVVPITVNDTECVSAVLEGLAILGYRDIMPVYYDTVIKSKLIRDNDSEEMLDLIREGIVVDMGALIYSHGQNPLNSIGYYLADEANQFTSFYAANVEIFKQYLTDIVNLYS